jgi:hypothetical protein
MRSSRRNGIPFSWIGRVGRAEPVVGGKQVAEMR